MTDHDAFLALSRHVDRGRYAVDRRLLLILLDRYLDRIGNLLLIVQEYLLADDLRSEEAQRLVRQRILRIERLALGQSGQNPVEQPADIEIVQGRDRNDLGVGQNPAPLPDQLLEPLGRRQIDLVDNQNCPDTAARDTVENLAAAVGPFDHVGHVQDDVTKRIIDS